MNIDDITNAIQGNRIRITEHADEEAETDDLTFDEIFFSVSHGEIIVKGSNLRLTVVRYSDIDASCPGH